jgi:hypothetical protein
MRFLENIPVLTPGWDGPDRPIQPSGTGFDPRVSAEQQMSIIVDDIGY